MTTIIQKFGGTSLRDHESRLKCIQHIKREIEANPYINIVVVVSAMGRKGDPYSTDSLLSLVDSTSLDKRETDLLLSTGELISASVFSSMLSNEDIKNTVLTGAQAGIITDNNHTNAKIKQFKTDRILKEFKEHKVVIVTGFQGISKDNEITTLGRGGSDTSATALGVALQANRVDIFTDVEGIYTTDPNVVETASLLKTMSYNEACNLAYLGAKVIHPRAVELAMQKNIPICVRSTFSSNEGTLITNVSEMNEHKIRDRTITGITCVDELVQVKVYPEKQEGNIHQQVFTILSHENISLDFINVNPLGVVFTIPSIEKNRVKNALKKHNLNPHFTENCSKISIVGAGIAGVPGVMNTIVTSLSEHSIPILQSSDSHTTIWVLIDTTFKKQAITSLHHNFNL